jgi:hypothetical protein
MAIAHKPSSIPDIAQYDDIEYIWGRIKGIYSKEIKQALASFVERRPPWAKKGQNMYLDFMRDALADAPAPQLASKEDRTSRKFFPIFKVEYKQRYLLYQTLLKAAGSVWVAEWVEPFVIRDVLKLLEVSPVGSNNRNGEILLLMLAHLNCKATGEHVSEVSKDLVAIIERRLSAVLSASSLAELRKGYAVGRSLLYEFEPIIWHHYNTLEHATQPKEAKDGESVYLWTALGHGLVETYPHNFTR